MHYKSKVIEGHAYESISLETNYIANAAKTVASFFPDMWDNVVGGFNTVASLKEYVPSFTGLTPAGLSYNENKIANTMAKTDYEDMRKFRMHVPEGFKGNLLTYFILMQQVLNYSQDIALPALQEFYVLVADVVSNKSSRKSVKDLAGMFSGYSKSREQYAKELASYFVPHSSQADRAFGEIFGGGRQLSEMYSEKYKLKRLLADIKISKYTDAVSKIRNGMQALVDIVGRGENTYLSPAQVKNITEGAYEMARQVEFFSLNYFRAYTACNIVESNEHNLLVRLRD